MPVQILERKNAPDLAYHFSPASGEGQSLPLVLFMGGFKSDMSGTKATYLEKQCRERGQAFCRFDYRGHGQSEGKFEDGTIGAWKQDALDILDHITGDKTERNVILVGSSMGGWIALLVLMARTEKIKAMIGLAAAPDFTHDLYHSEMSEDQRRILEEKGRIENPNDYSDEPYIFTKELFDEAENHFLLNKKNAVEVPITLIQGMKDTEVPWEVTARIQKAFTGQEVDILLLEEADHRLSRPEDLELIDKEILNLSHVKEP